jgi:hypothetical protein
MNGLVVIKIANIYAEYIFGMSADLNYNKGMSPDIQKIDAEEFRCQL